MHTKKKNIIICKFNLNNKSKFEEKCRFQHISVNELNDIINKYQDLKQENAPLKLILKEKSLKIINLDKKKLLIRENILLLKLLTELQLRIRFLTLK